MTDRLLQWLDALDLRWIVLTLALTVFGVTECHAHDDAVADQARLQMTLQERDRDVTHWQALYAAQARGLQVKHDTLVQRVTQYKTLRDTLVEYWERHDTVAVANTIPVFIRRTDSTVASCTEAASACQRFHVTADSTIGALGRENDAVRAYVNTLHRRTLKERLVDVTVSAATGYLIGRVVR